MPPTEMPLHSSLLQFRFELDDIFDYLEYDIFDVPDVEFESRIFSAHQESC